MRGRCGVAAVVPDGFDAYLRLLHPLDRGGRWSDVAPEYLRSGDQRYPYPFPESVRHAEGDMGGFLVDLFVSLLATATATPHECHFGLWTGWGELHPGSHAVAYARKSLGLTDALRRVRPLSRDSGPPSPSGSYAGLYAFVERCPVQPWWGGRDMLLFDGPIEAVVAIGAPAFGRDEIRRRGPQWWWPADRRWFVATEIDYPWTYIGGATALVDVITASIPVEGVPVTTADLW